jgi:hypothetical protein
MNTNQSKTVSEIFMEYMRIIRKTIDSMIPKEKENLISLTALDGSSEKLDKSSVFYVFLVFLANIVCNPLALGIPFLLLSLWFSAKIVNFKQLFKTKAFYEDDISYGEVTELYNIFGVAHINDFALFLLILCAFYGIALTYLSMSPYVNKNTRFFTKQKMEVYILLGVSVFIALSTIILNYSGSQSMTFFGGKRDEFDEKVYDNINLNYIDFLISQKANDTSLIDANKLDNLQNYINDTLVTIGNRQNISSSQFNKLTTEDGDFIHKKISSSIITYGILLNFKVNHFEEFSTTKIDRSFFQNKSSLLPTISTITNDLFTIETKAFNLTNDNLDSPYIEGIIDYCKKQQHEINCLISKIRQIKNIMIPYYHISIFFELMLCVSYFTLVFMGY